MRTLLVALALIVSSLSLAELVHVCERFDDLQSELGAREQAEKARTECSDVAARCETLALECLEGPWTYDEPSGGSL